jgi:hypothetical protein
MNSLDSLLPDRKMAMTAGCFFLEFSGSKKVIKKI